MGLFKDMLGSDESLFKNEMALDYEFVPKMMPYRELQQKQVAACIKPLLFERTGKNLLIHGAPGIGKTAAIKWVFRDLEDETDEVVPVYINCWQKNTTFKILTEVCHQLGYKFTQNKRTEELFEVIKDIANKKAVVFAFDEIDKAEDHDFLYSILEEVYKKSVFLITNYKEWITELDERIKSRLMPEILEFKQYNASETEGILKKRIGHAFVPGVWEDSALKIVSGKTFDMKDIRSGLFLLRESGCSAEEGASRKIKDEHAKSAIEKMNEFSIKKSTDLEDETREMLDIVKDNSGKKIGELFEIYQQKGGGSSYKTFQRKIDKLEKNKFVKVKKISGGSEGKTTIVSFNEIEKKLSDF